MQLSLEELRGKHKYLFSFNSMSYSEYFSYKFQADQHLWVWFRYLTCNQTILPMYSNVRIAKPIHRKETCWVESSNNFWYH